jgi:PAS domain S-box-containing protein
VKNVVKTGHRITEEMQFTWKGETLWFRDSLSPIRDTNGTIIGVEMISHNITEQKRAETALREREEKYRTIAKTSD